MSKHDNWIVIQKSKKEQIKDWQQHMSDQKKNLPSAVDPGITDALRALTGENAVGGSRTRVPIISFNQNPERTDMKFAEFSLQTGKDSNGAMQWESLGESFDGIIMKVRMQLKGYKEREQQSYWSNEFDGWNETVTLYTKGRELVDTGLTRELKDKYDFISSTYQLYILLPGTGTVGKLQVKGASMAEFIRYFPQYAAGRDSIAQFVTHFGTEKGKKGAVVFYKIIPTRGAPASSADIEKVMGFLGELRAVKGDVVPSDDAEPTRPRLEDIPF